MSATTKFLEQVADYFFNGKNNSDNIGLADTIFILPNKRSAMFLRRYVQQRIQDKYAFMPRFTTFGKFIARRSSLKVASRYDCLFTLYNSYINVLKKHNRTDTGKTFDKFIFWGDMILSDFEQIDTSMVDAGKLYTNLANIHNISTDFLTEEQKAVVRDIWGETSYTQHIDTFWRHTHASGEETEMTRKFIDLWQILAEIYADFNDSLLQRGMATEGMQTRRVAEVVKQSCPTELRRNRFVFVGHSDLSTAQIAIMKRLQECGAAMFFWDMPSSIFGDDSGNKGSEVVKILSNLCAQFRMPDDFNLKEVDTYPEIDIIGISSAVGQGKQAADIVSKWNTQGLIDTANINTAIVLPDESLLTHMLLAMPEDITDINVTMSVPYSATTFATLIRVIISLQLRAKQRSDGTMTFFFKDVLEVLRHPHIRIIAAQESEAIIKKIEKKKLYNIDAPALTTNHPSLAFIFKPIHDIKSVQEVYDYLVGLINGLQENIQRVAGKQSDTLELNTLEYYRQSLDELYKCVNDYGISMQEVTFFILFEQILNSSKMSLSGTPLRGLQIMGVLETRALDFDNIIILSMNERQMPRKDYIKTMIPNNLRRGYGLEPIDRRESYYAYYFYRLLARAKRVTLLYDSRAGNHSGEMSRYLSQLMYLHDHNNIRHCNVVSSGIRPLQREIKIDKDDVVMLELSRYTVPNELYLSASALKSYLTCPLSFYLKYVKGMRDDEEPLGYITPAQLGDIFHHTMMNIYGQYSGKVISAQVINSLLSGNAIERMVTSEIDNVVYHSKIPVENRSTEAKINGAIICKQVRKMLEAERDCYCNNSTFDYVAGEEEVKGPWAITDELTVNFKMQIDRIDRLGSEELRFIDYKTGSDELSVGSDLKNLFSGKHSCQGIFQLMLYAEAYKDMEKSVNVKQIHLAIHSLRKITTSGKIENLTYNRKPLPPYPKLDPEFRDMLNVTVESIFDRNIPFKQCADLDNCKYCKFTQLCGRVVVDKKYN